MADVDPADAHADPDRVRQVVELAEVADRAGLSGLWVAEHHFGGGGACPSPPVLLAACGARTRSLRLGSLVSVLPFHRAVDVAEEYALVDRLLNGRLNFGVGSGYLASEFAGFGVDPSEKRDRFDRALDVILSAFSGAGFQAGPAGSPVVRLNVLPVQQPHPPIWVAVQRREAIPHVAARGLGIAVIPYATVADLGELAGQIAEYRRRLPPGIPGSVLAAVHVYSGNRPEMARAAFRRYLDSRLKTHSTFYEHKAHRAPDQADPAALERADLAVFGSPEEVARRLQRYSDAGVDELLGMFDFGGLAADATHRSVEATARAWETARSA